MNQKNNQKSKRWLWLLPAVLAVWCTSAVLSREPAAPAATEPMPTVTIQQDEEISLGQGLVIERVDRYSGVYMEDGSDETVQDVMMMLLRNDSDRCSLIRVDFGG